MYSADTLEQASNPAGFIQTLALSLKPVGELVVTFPNEIDGHGIAGFLTENELRALFECTGLTNTVFPLKLRLTLVGAWFIVAMAFSWILNATYDKVLG